MTKNEIQQLVEALKPIIIQSINEAMSRSVPEEVFGSKEAAKYLCIAQSTLRNKVHNKEIPYTKRKRKLYFSRRDLNSYLRSAD